MQKTSRKINEEKYVYGTDCQYITDKRFRVGYVAVQRSLIHETVENSTHSISISRFVSVFRWDLRCSRCSTVQSLHNLIFHPGKSLIKKRRLKRYTTTITHLRNINC